VVLDNLPPNALAGNLAPIWLPGSVDRYWSLIDRRRGIGVARCAPERQGRLSSLAFVGAYLCFCLVMLPGYHTRTKQLVLFALGKTDALPIRFFPSGPVTRLHSTAHRRTHVFSQKFETHEQQSLASSKKTKILRNKPCGTQRTSCVGSVELFRNHSATWCEPDLSEVRQRDSFDDARAGA